MYLFEIKSFPFFHMMMSSCWTPFISSMICRVSTPGPDQLCNCTTDKLLAAPAPAPDVALKCQRVCVCVYYVFVITERDAAAALGEGVGTYSFLHRRPADSGSQHRSVHFQWLSFSLARHISINLQKFSFFFFFRFFSCCRYIAGPSHHI